MTKDEIIKTLRDMAKYPTVTLPRDCEALRMAADLLAQPEQEPVEVFLTDEHQMGFKVGVQSFILDYWPDLQSEVEFMKTQLLTAFARAKAPQRTWIGLTDEEIKSIWLSGKDYGDDWLDVQSIAQAIEAKLKEKNT